MRPRKLRTKLTLWYVTVLAVLLALYIGLVFIFQYAVLTRQVYHDEVQDVETVEGLLYFDQQNVLHLREDYHSHPRSHLLIDRLMEVRDLSGNILYRSDTLHGSSLGGSSMPEEGNGTFNQRVVKMADGEHVFLISHLHGMQGRTVLIRLGYSLSLFRDRMEQFFALLLVALPAGLLLAGFAGYAIAKRALQPMEEMAARAEQITASNLHDRLEVENEHDELGHMARVFNHLLERLEQAFEQLRRFTANAAHELRTPLASLRAVGEVALQEASTPEEYREAIGSILEETRRLNQTIEGLLLLAKAESAQPGKAQTSFPIPELVREVLNLLGVLIEERNVTVSEVYEDNGSLIVYADRSLVRIALINVIHNAVKFSPQDSPLQITYGTNTSHAQVSIHDSGPGIASSDEQLVFERFFTGTSSAASANRGSGLGLSIAKLVLERDGGSITFDTAVLHGAKCIIRLPLAP
ncbi:ATP-binding protein [Terriglobus saanensis]|uniref:histidine kinase n=1 Tax=Terriglobus saanensis (strain ATCC BAA-1853 / DSM 23119 / SP1PR4) TaxID=401053 RepID=E8V2S2_TERSS|nr:ATP-binding protein [Terriglobus saanensis]ADV83547.1 integral membrane sensor signal transduction histidine kinase [Terriglobus saanensis SP1PR4]